MLLDVEPNRSVNLQQIALEKGRKLLRNKFESVEEALVWLGENQEALVQITIVTENYLEPKDKKLLLDAHAYMMPIIPEVKKMKRQETEKDLTLALEHKSMEELFLDYFKNSKEGKGQSPSESILKLFKEVLAQEK